MVGYFDEDENKVIVCGGEDDAWNVLDTCFEYSLETDEWNEANFKMKEKRAWAASVVLNNGSFFVLGGDDPSFETLEYSEFPIEGHYGPRLPYEATGHCLCQPNQNRLFMAGGHGRGLSKLAFLLDLNTGEWTQLPDMIEARNDHICHQINGGKEVLAIGGDEKSSVESFAFDSMSWKEVNSLPREIQDARYAVEYKDTFLIVGGWDWDYGNLDTLYEFVPSAEYRWVERSEKLAQRRSRHLSFPLKSGWKEKAKVCE